LPRGETPPIEYGKAATVVQGKGLALVSVGTMMETALAVREGLLEKGHDPSVYNARFVKPVDAELVEKLAAYDHVFVLQDAARRGGYGEALRLPRAHDFAFPDAFIEAGTQKELLARYQLDEKSITAFIINRITTNKEILP
jgi:1-deoxy-D-xylulose-5-phosphate synthase